jgi:hypothetical protein
LCPDYNIVMMKILPSYCDTLASGTTIVSLIKRGGEFGFYFRKNRQCQSLPAMFRVPWAGYLDISGEKAAGKLGKSV